MIDTSPDVAVTTLLHERAIAIAKWPVRGVDVDGDSAGALSPCDSHHGEVRRGIPARELGVERVSVVRPHAQAVVAAERRRGRENDAVSAHESAAGTPAAVHLHDGRRDGVDDVGDGVGEGEK